ncbi:hypothetical protein JNUCC42_17635 [Brevibacterium sp. JNUCC-42]|nr:hypothetical protein JNUCC42_17635 [Brevibacterium sp. JNUCC-42]
MKTICDECQKGFEEKNIQMLEVHPFWRLSRKHLKAEALYRTKIKKTKQELQPKMNRLIM